MGRIAWRGMPRLNIAEGVYHVTQRGVEQLDIVADDEDRQEWLRLLGRNATAREIIVCCDSPETSGEQSKQTACWSDRPQALGRLIAHAVDE